MSKPRKSVGSFFGCFLIAFGVVFVWAICRLVTTNVDGVYNIGLLFGKQTAMNAGFTIILAGFLTMILGRLGQDN